MNMEFSVDQILIAVVLAFTIGALLSYLLVRALRVSRYEYDNLKESLGSTQNELDTHKAIVNQLASDKAQLESKIQQEQVLNRSQEQKTSAIVAKHEALVESYKIERATNDKQQEEISNNQGLITRLNKETATLAANNQSLLDKLDSHKEEIVAIRKESALHFETVANRLLEEKSEKFSKANKESIEMILGPLQENIKTFAQKVESSTKESVDRHSSLKQMIKHVSDQSQKVANDANNLAKALKGDYKQQGNWGELVLQSILDKSGLEKDREYFVQKSEKDNEGKAHRPDIVISLPDNKRLIVDSKVSLVAYDAMIAADDKEQAERHQKNHSIAIKNHVKGLADKNYHDLYQVESPDFVMMFIPIDTAFSAALRQDPTLFDYAFSKNIIIVTASTLLATLKTVETIWKNVKQNKHALAIASEAGKMYDKFVGFVEEMEKMGSQLTTVQKTYEGSMKKLSLGNGNLIRRAEKIKQLGANANKSISQPSFAQLG